MPKKKKAAFSQSGNKRTVHCWARGELVSVKGFQAFKGRELAKKSDIENFDLSDYSQSTVRYNPKRENCMMVGDYEYIGSPSMRYFPQQRGMAAIFS